MDELTKEDIGTVIAVNGTKVTVEICPSEGCTSCSMNGMCGMGNKNKHFTLDTDQKVKVGDQVTLQIHGGSEVVSSLVLFLLPILLMIFGFVIGRFVFGLSEGNAVLVSILGLGLSFFVVRLIDHFYGKKIFLTIIPKDGSTDEGEDDENTSA